jgi:hypothetical protein
MKKITLVTMDDWTAVYVNGKLMAENHSVSNDELLKVLGISYESITLEDDTCIMDFLPQKLEDLDKIENVKLTREFRSN